MKIYRRLLTVFCVLMLAGCASNGINKSIKEHEAVRSFVELGQSKEQVLTVLARAQRDLQPRYGKPPESYMYDGKKREVYFLRSRSFNDGLVTDDEFTPYVFEDNVLVAIGWTAIGGPKTQAQVRDEHSRIHVSGRYRHFW